jgi:hypothetical protein
MASGLRRGALFLWVLLGGAGSLSAATNWSDVVRVTAATPFGAASAERMRYTADDLTRRSPTFRQMLDVLRSTPHLVLGAQPAEPSRSLGRGHFHVEGSRTIGIMEIVVHQDAQLRVRAVAHELAHAVEIACLPPQPDTAALQRTLAQRGGYFNIGPRGMETPFAAAVERVVLREAWKARDAPGRLPMLAAKYDLPRCARPEEELQVAGR